MTELAIEMIKKEIDLLKRLDHPNIMKVYNVIEDNDKIYMITDDFRGPNLFNYTISKCQLTESEAASIAAQMASCIKYLHKHDIVLRRLKLESIYFAENESIHEVRLTDLFLVN